MIRIVNWLLTRKCNLNCDYCAIVRDYPHKPAEYPDMKHYHTMEMSTDTVLQGIAKLTRYNSQCFHIFYGGEPMLREDLPDIIEHCHNIGAHYTIISNNTTKIQPLIKGLVSKVKRIEGFTASVDPILVDKGAPDSDRLRKTREGFEFLLSMKKYCKDLVAEVTVMKEDQHLIYDLVKFLSINNINSDITFIDIAKSPYYDFSNLSSERELVEPTPDLAYELMRIIMDKKLDVHMKTDLIPAIFASLPSKMDCGIEKSLHNVSIDADGSVRLCLRIRGVHTPTYVNVKDLLSSGGVVNTIAHKLIKKDKKEFCKLCNHTCQLMSQILDESGRRDGKDLVHSDRRTY
jgi:MoaA/NifB/PqqE/SkfB family radical SAM enzyme